VVAAGQYRRVHGKWPEKLRDLAPEFLKAAPKDIYSEKGEKEVEYAVGAEGVTLRSIGRKLGSGKRDEVVVGIR
jgi:hypothetical protein